MNWNKLLVFLSGIALFLNACTNEKSSLDPVITVESLHSILEDENLILLDARDRESFESGHIPGSINLDWEDLIDEDHAIYGMLIREKEFKSKINQLGIDPGKNIVIYDEQGAVEAARVWWVLKNYGFERISILDGGIIPWRSMGYSEAKGYAEPLPSRTDNFSFMEFRTIGLEDIQAAMKKDEYLILDARCEAEYLGEMVKDGAQKGGRIPGSINVDYIENYNINEKGELLGFKSKKELEELYGSVQVRPERKIVVYCHTAVRSSLTTFVLTELLNYPEVYNYDGSWREWSTLTSDQIE